MKLEELSRNEFDALVTGELTHFSIWMEDQLVELISRYFVTDVDRRANFARLLLRRDGLTFQDKIEIARAMEGLFDNIGAADWRKLLQRVEKFKSLRNAFAHGLDVSVAQSHTITVEIITRSGKERHITVTPQTHNDLMANAEEILLDLEKACRLACP